MQNVIKNLFFMVLFFPLFLNAEGGLPTDSIYHLNSEWSNQKGEVKNLRHTKGEIYLVSMFFSSCPSACPMIVMDIKNILAKIDAQTAQKIRVKMFSFDHEVDLPDQLQSFFKKHKLTERWELFHGEADAIATLAAALKVQYKRLNKGSYAHSNQIFLIGKDGTIVAQLDELGANADSLVEAAVKALK